MFSTVLVWFAMLLVSMANGALRDLGYGPWLSPLLAHQVSTATELLLLWAVMAAYFHWVPPTSKSEAWRIGLVWMVMTVAFEFLFFHYVGKHSWAALLANYDVMHGRVWVFVPLWLLVGPVLFHRHRVRSSDRTLFHSM